MQKLSVVIPNWNGKDLLTACLASLQNQTQAAQVIVVDNGSTDGSVELIKKNFSQVILVELPKNRGFAAGVNVGIRRALADGADLIALLNNDALAEKDWLEQLASTAQSLPEVGIIASKLMHTDKSHFDSTGELFYSWGTPGPRGRGKPDAGQYNQTEYVFGGSGGSSAYRSKMLEQIGLFDEDFFAYYEDADLSFRAQLAGWKVYYQSSAVVYHHINATSGRVRGMHAYHMAKNMPWVIWKNMPLKLLPITLLKFSLYYSVVLAGLAGQGLGFYALKGFAVSLFLLPKKLIQRQAIQHRRTVSTTYIKSLFSPGLPPGTTKLAKLLSVFGVGV